MGYSTNEYKPPVKCVFFFPHIRYPEYIIACVVYFMEQRKKLGLTQEALAEKGEMTTQFVSYAEAGKRAMRPENLLKISSALGVSADYLLTGDIVDKDLLLLSDKLRKLPPSKLRIIENIIDESVILFSEQ